MEEETAEQTRPSFFSLLASFGWFPLLVLALVVLLIVGLVGTTAYILGKKSQGPTMSVEQTAAPEQNGLSQPTPPSTKAGTATLPSPMPVPTYSVPTLPNSEITFVTHRLDLYNLSVDLPANYKITETNRRKQSMDSGNPEPGADCADYTITSNDNYTIISLRPVCGFAESSPQPYPEGVVVVKQLSSNKSLVRVFDSNRSVYEYGTGSKATISTLSGTHEENTYFPSLSFNKNQRLIIMNITLQYFGPNSQRDQYLKVADGIIASIR